MTFPPRQVTADIVNPDQPATSTRRYAMYQGDTFQILDEFGDPFDGTGFTMQIELREGPKADGWPVLATGSASWVDSTTGEGIYEISVPDDCPQLVFADLELTNVSNPDFAVGHKETKLRYSYLCQQEFTA